MQAETSKLTYSRCLELLVVFAAGISFSGLLAARIGKFDAPAVWVVAILGTLAYHRLTRSYVLTSGLPPLPYWHWAVVILVGLLFRLVPYEVILGWQDQGVYISMAATLAREHAMVPVDTVLAAISDPATREAYYVTNYTNAVGGYLPGVYPGTGPGLEFQFYHLFPVWLAVFGAGIDPAAGVYGLTFLSILSLLLFQQLASLISGSRSVGLAAGLLLAINPLHAFFSKFHVTEVPTLAFSLMGFTMLVMYWKCYRQPMAWRFLILSVLAFAQVFLTRITGFLFVPFVLVVAFFSLAVDDDARRRNAMQFWALAVITVYAFSVYYGLKWSGIYSAAIYDMNFKPVLGEHWLALASGSFAIIILAWFGLWFTPHSAWKSRLLGVTHDMSVKGLPFLLALLGAYAAYKAYRIGFTYAYVNDPWIAERWALAGKGWESIWSTSPFVAMVYLSPFVLFAYFALSFKTDRNYYLLGLLFCTVCFFGAIVVGQPIVPYQPYYARYLVSELIPYVLLFVICTFAQAAYRRRMAQLVLGLSAIWFVALSVQQLGKTEEVGVKQLVQSMQKTVDGTDLILIDAGIGSPGTEPLKAAILLVYGLNVATIDAKGLADPDYVRKIGSEFADTYLLTYEGGEVPNFSLQDKIGLSINGFERTNHPPSSQKTVVSRKLALYRFDPDHEHPLTTGEAPVVAAGSGSSTAPLLIDFGKERNRSSLLMLKQGWSVPEDRGVWNDGTTALLTLQNEPPPTGSLSGNTVRLTGKVLVTAKHPTQRIIVSVGGKKLISIKATYPSTDASIEFQLPAEAGKTGPIDVQLDFPDAKTPAELGQSADGRRLAFALMSIEILPASHQAN